MSILDNSDSGFVNDLDYAFEKQYEEISKLTNGNLYIFIFLFILSLGCTILIMAFEIILGSLMFLGLTIGTLVMIIHIMKFKRSKFNYRFNLVSYVNIFTLIIFMNAIWILICGLLNNYLS